MKTIHLTHLYPKEMAIYGDLGNIISLRDVLESNGYHVIVQNIGIGDSLPDRTDWYFIGGGADKDQYQVVKDLQKKSTILLEQLSAGIPLLAICGGYQLLGESFVGGDGTRIQGLSWFPVTTVAPDSNVKSRSVGNIVVESRLPGYTGKLVGFENHGGQTSATSTDFQPLGSVINGYGNNQLDKEEGCIKLNTVGCYLHGPCLAKNPLLLSFFAEIITKNSIRISPDYTKLNQSLVERFGQKNNP